MGLDMKRTFFAAVLMQDREFLAENQVVDQGLLSAIGRQLSHYQQTTTGEPS